MLLYSICYYTTDFFQVFYFNFFNVLASNELVIINFYADWCRFSGILAPIFDEAAAKVTKLYPDPGRVVLGKVDCDTESKKLF